MLEDEQLEAEFTYNKFERLTELEDNISSSNTEAIPVQNRQVPLAASCVSAPKLQCVKSVEYEPVNLSLKISWFNLKTVWTLYTRRKPNCRF